MIRYLLMWLLPDRIIRSWLYKATFQPMPRSRVKQIVGEIGRRCIQDDRTVNSLIYLLYQDRVDLDEALKVLTLAVGRQALIIRAQYHLSLSDPLSRQGANRLLDQLNASQIGRYWSESDDDEGDALVGVIA